jgi:hypothetical protein
MNIFTFFVYCVTKIKEDSKCFILNCTILNLKIRIQNLLEMLDLDPCIINTVRNPNPASSYMKPLCGQAHLGARGSARPIPRPGTQPGGGGALSRHLLLELLHHQEGAQLPPA